MRSSLLAVAGLAALAAAQFCASDPARSGCWLCSEGYLLQCLQTSQNVTSSACSSLPGLVEQASCYCQHFTTQANCWATGVQCAEWISMQIDGAKLQVRDGADGSADKACGFASMLKGGKAADEAATSTLASISSDQLRVSSSIWHNDAGTDIPTATDGALETLA